MKEDWDKFGEDTVDSNESFEEINLGDYSDNMKSYHLIHRIYDIYNYFFQLEDDYMDYKSIESNMNLILNYISDINFVFIYQDSLDKIKETEKVGVLLNLEVYLNPELDNRIIFWDGEKKNNFELKVNI